MQGRQDRQDRQDRQERNIVNNTCLITLMSVSSKCGSDQVGGSFFLQSSLFEHQWETKNKRNTYMQSKYQTKTIYESYAEKYW